MAGSNWQPEEWYKYKNYADEVWVQLQFIEPRGAKDLPVEDWILTFSPSTEWDQDWLLQRIEPLGYMDTPGSEQGQPVYVMQVIDRKVNWGADASTFSVLMDIGIGVLGGAAWDGIKVIHNQIKKNNEYSAEPLDEQEAIERVRWMLCRRYKITEEQLQLESVEIYDSDAIVTMKGPEGVTYRCQLVERDGLVMLARITWTAS